MHTGNDATCGISHFWGFFFRSVSYLYICILVLISFGFVLIDDWLTETKPNHPRPPPGSGHAINPSN